MRLLASLALSLVVLPSLASAAAPAGADPATVAASAPAPATQADLGAQEDVTIDRSFLLPTAQTQPKGKLAMSDYELFFLGLSYGLTDHLQLSTEAFIPLEGESVIAASVKWQFLRAGRLRLAVLAGV